jgi:outer membrane protein assembly factor BamD (BamD/ComL family)
MRKIRTLLVCLTVACCCCLAQAQKKYVDQGEFDAYNEVTKDIAAGNFTKALADLDTWRNKYPTTEFHDDRELLYVQCFFSNKQFAKALDSSRDLLSKVDKLDAKDAVKVLYYASSSVQQVTETTPEEIATGENAARALSTFNRKPEGVADDAWATTKAQLQSTGKAASLYAELLPGTQAMKKNDCATAESAFRRALEDYPESGQAAWYLGSAELCLYKTQPERASIALYEFARASVVDPAKGMVDPKWQQQTVAPYLEKVYTQYHGADPEGLKQLKQLAAASALPPAGFAIKSIAQIAQEKQAQFEASNPQLALWLKIKGALADANGEQYFTSTLKDSAVPQLKGVLVEARPACHPKELLVAVPLPDSPQSAQAEIKLKLDKPLTGKPQSNTEIHWEGIPTAFTPSPFLLTMDTESAKVEGLKSSPCGTVTAKKKR